VRQLVAVVGPTGSGKTTLGIELDSDKAYNEQKEIYQTKGLTVRARAVVQTAEGDKTGLWTTVVSAAVFVM